MIRINKFQFRLILSLSIIFVTPSVSQADKTKNKKNETEQLESYAESTIAPVFRKNAAEARFKNNLRRMKSHKTGIKYEGKKFDQNSIDHTKSYNTAKDFDDLTEVTPPASSKHTQASPSSKNKRILDRRPPKEAPPKREIQDIKEPEAQARKLVKPKEHYSNKTIQKLIHGKKQPEEVHIQPEQTEEATQSHENRHQPQPKDHYSNTVIEKLIQRKRARQLKQVNEKAISNQKTKENTDTEENLQDKPSSRSESAH